ncbi:MAG: hypothetical protein JWR05_3371 [Mucilaginibacter sp.]|nr:hypothetical protein [Mucilaginibacter sp.]
MNRFEIETMKREFLPKGLPTQLSKYHRIDKYLHESLRGGYFWHSSRTSFNDPYDCYKHLLTFDASNEQLIEYAKRTLLPGEDLDLVTNFILEEPNMVYEAYINSVDSILDSQGICCFTTNHESTLMWSHYAQHHRGVCLVFDTHCDVESFMVAKVRYTDEFIPRNYFDNQTNAAMILLTTKSKAWEYEDEYRLIDIRQGAIPYKREALRCIIFGCKTNQEDMLSIINTVETSGYKNVEYWEAYTLPNSFKIAFRLKPLLVL